MITTDPSFATGAAARLLETYTLTASDTDKTSISNTKYFVFMLWWFKAYCKCGLF